MTFGKITMSSFLHGAIAFSVSGSIYGLGVLTGNPQVLAWLIGPTFFYGREMKEYQKWREQQGDGKDNKFQAKDFNPFNYNKGGKGDGTADTLIPFVVCAASALVASLV